MFFFFYFVYVFFFYISLYYIFDIIAKECIILYANIISNQCVFFIIHYIVLFICFKKAFILLYVLHIIIVSYGFALYTVI